MQINKNYVHEKGLLDSLFVFARVYEKTGPIFLTNVFLEK